MDFQTQKIRPDYKRIYTDLIFYKYSEKESACKSILQKKSLSNVDVIALNKLLFGNKELEFNQKLKAYEKKDILKILLFQKKNNMNDSELSRELKISRNTIFKWKKKYLV
jgi:transcriptional regulator with PAS, ATPase and Fis domain